MKILVTGSAGFIGSALTIRLLERGDEVVGIDNQNDYYDPALKEARLSRHINHPNYNHFKLSIEDGDAISKIFSNDEFDVVVNLAAQAGVRYSIENPSSYISSNLVGFGHILEGCRHHNVGHLVYASSSSVYGSNTKMPFSIHDNVDHPLSLYAASKKANELMAHTYSHLYGLPTTGLRFFTVYGPWGRPDMALFLFTKAILEGRPIDVFNEGKMRRDFTYIDDIVEGVDRTSQQIATSDAKWDSGSPTPASSNAPYRVFNIGNNEPVELNHFIECIENSLGLKAVRNLLPMQPGDVPATYADIEALEQAVGFRPSTPIEVGIDRFVGWYRKYYQV